jgi:hypothetical protein
VCDSKILIKCYIKIIHKILKLKNCTCFVGNFAGTDAKDDYAIGAPNANGYRGSVYICPNCFGDGEGSDTPTEIHGTQIGERFGHTMCAVDVNGDGFDDIVVGAPLYSSKTTVSG